MQQGELTADELGLLLASLAGFSPERQLASIEAEAADDAGGTPLISTHPNVQLRLVRLRASMPLARRLVALAGG
jgi:Zn-dependent protease with chaperone function